MIFVINVITSIVVRAGSCGQTVVKVVSRHANATLFQEASHASKLSEGFGHAVAAPPEWLMERRKRSEAAMITVIADCYLAGVSTRRMDKLVKILGIHSLSKSQVSRMAADLDEHVEQFRHRPLGDAGPFTFVAADALTMKVREGGRVINAVVLVATGVNADGHLEVLGLRVATSETGAAWNSFFADLVARGLSGVRLVTSDAHAGLVEPIAANLPGASWQRCRTHYTREPRTHCGRNESEDDRVLRGGPSAIRRARSWPRLVAALLARSRVPADRVLLR